MRTIELICMASAMIVACAGCECLDNDIEKHGAGDPVFIALDDVARILTEIPLGTEHVGEVYDAVSSSSENGYDEEYTMQDLFRSPGAGVGDSCLPEGTKTSGRAYRKPLRELIEEHVSGVAAKSSPSGSGDISPERYLSALGASDVQIYWPFSEKWDGKAFPIITFDPGDGTDSNIGYVMSGNGIVEEVVVDEKMASERPVWVVNRNDDSGYTSLEMFRRQDPEWGSGGGSVIVRPKGSLLRSAGVSGSPLRTLVLKEFTMKRNYDSWFAGASEFFVKIGSVEDFSASTEAELRLYSPSVTDFMIVVKRNQVGKPQPFNAVLVSDWSDQLSQCAFMITEDDGGTRTSWKCTALVRIASKSYGVELEIPFSTRDDIVWRGQLSDRYIFNNSDKTGHFGDVDLRFEILE